MWITLPSLDSSYPSSQYNVKNMDRISIVVESIVESGHDMNIDSNQIQTEVEYGVGLLFMFFSTTQTVEQFETLKMEF